MPWVVGRASSSGLALSGPGIWDRHLVFQMVPGDGLTVQVEKGAIARVGGKSFQSHRVRNGDRIEVGDTTLSVGLAPPGRRSLTVWGAMFWSLLAGVLMVQALLFFRLSRTWFEL